MDNEEKISTQENEVLTQEITESIRTMLQDELKAALTPLWNQVNEHSRLIHSIQQKEEALALKAETLTPDQVTEQIDKKQGDFVASVNKQLDSHADYIKQYSSTLQRLDKNQSEQSDMLAELSVNQGKISSSIELLSVRMSDTNSRLSATESHFETNRVELRELVTSMYSDIKQAEHKTTENRVLIEDIDQRGQSLSSDLNEVKTSVKRLEEFGIKTATRLIGVMSILVLGSEYGASAAELIIGVF
jgi:chromosome segregation ATPase